LAANSYTFRLTEEEAVQVREAAEAAGLSPTAFCKQKVLATVNENRGAQAPAEESLKAEYRRDSELSQLREILLTNTATLARMVETQQHFLVAKTSGSESAEGEARAAEGTPEERPDAAYGESLEIIKEAIVKGTSIIRGLDINEGRLHENTSRFVEWRGNKQVTQFEEKSVFLACLLNAVNETLMDKNVLKRERKLNV